MLFHFIRLLAEQPRTQVADAGNAPMSSSEGLVSDELIGGVSSWEVTYTEYTLQLYDFRLE